MSKRGKEERMQELKRAPPVLGKINIKMKNNNQKRGKDSEKEIDLIIYPSGQKKITVDK